MINLYGKILLKYALTEADRLTYTPDTGEPLWCVQTGKLFLGDGHTVGGIVVNDTSDFQNQIDALQLALDQEVADRTAADDALDARIDGVIIDLGNEAEARVAADAELQVNINDEVVNRTNADTALDARIDQEITDRQDAITTEASTRQTDDEALGIRIDGVVTNLTQEVTNRMEADFNLSDRIDAANSDVTQETADRIAADLVLQSNIDQEVTDRKAAITAEASTRGTADALLQTHIDAEATTRGNNDTALGVRIDNEIIARSDEDTILQGNIDDEASTRETNDQAIQANVDQEVIDRTAADTALGVRIDNTNTALSTEVTNRTNADTALGTRITTEVNDREAGETQLQHNIDLANTAISDETADRIAADLVLQGNITTEVTNRTNADATLQSNIDGVADNLADEITARQSGDTTIQGNLDIHIADHTNPHEVDKTQVGLGNVDNTSDINKPVSTAQQSALDLKANSADLATVATSGSYNDLSDKPTVVGQVNADWNATTGVEQILNKPTTIAGYGITDAINISQKGASNGIASLDANGKVPVGQLPSIAVTETYVVASQSAQLALSTQEGDIVIRTDINKTYINNGGTTGTMADYTQFLSPDAAVSSVNGMVGAVTIGKADVGLGNVDNTSDANKPVSSATQTALDGKQNVFGSQTAKFVYAAPNAADGIPLFRALLASDLPSLSYVPLTRNVTAGTGLTGGGALSADVTIGLSTGSQASLALADSSLQDSDIGTNVQAYSTNLDAWALLTTVSKANSNVTITAGTGLTGGGDISTNRTVALSSGSIASLAKADSALQSTDIGVSVQGYSANLAAWSAITTASKANSGITISVGTGLSGGGDLTANRTVSLSTGTQASLAKADTALQSADIGVSVQGFSANLTAWAAITTASKANSSITVTAGTGLSGGGDLTANRTVALSSGSIASLALADSSLQSSAIGTTVQGYSANLAAWSAITTASKVSTGTITTSGLTMATATILGRTSASTGAVEQITVGSGLSLAGGVLSSTANGTVTSVDGTGSTGLTVTGGPIIGSGTLTMTLSANLQSWSAIAPSTKADTSALGNYLPLTGGTLTGALTGTAATFTTAVAPLNTVTVTGATTLSTAHTNRIIMKTNTSALTFTMPNNLGTVGDAITVVNGGTAGDITLTAGTGATIYKAGVAGNFTVPSFTSTTLVKVTSAIWIA